MPSNWTSRIAGSFGSKPAPIIVGGCFRSGTTLVRRILDAHSRIHCPPEVKFFSDLYGKFKDDNLASHRFFATARQMGLTTKQLLIEFGGAFVKCHEIAAAGQKKKRWADKNPNNVLFTAQWNTILDQRFQFVMVVRHPLDTLSSLIEARFDKSLAEDFDGRVELVRQYITAGVEFVDANPERSFVVRYEDLVATPDATVKEMMSFLGESFEPSVLKEFNSPERQAGFEDQKIKATSDIHTQSVARWQQDLSPEEIRIATEKYADLMARFGYADSK